MLYLWVGPLVSFSSPPINQTCTRCMEPLCLELLSSSVSRESRLFMSYSWPRLAFFNRARSNSELMEHDELPDWGRPGTRDMVSFSSPSRVWLVGLVDRGMFALFLYNPDWGAAFDGLEGLGNTEMPSPSWLLDLGRAAWLFCFGWMTSAGLLCTEGVLWESGPREMDLWCSIWVLLDFLSLTL